MCMSVVYVCMNACRCVDISPGVCRLIGKQVKGELISTMLNMKVCYVCMFVPMG